MPARARARTHTHTHTLTHVCKRRKGPSSSTHSSSPLLESMGAVERKPRHKAILASRIRLREIMHGRTNYWNDLSPCFDRWETRRVQLSQCNILPIFRPDGCSWPCTARNTSSALWCSTNASSYFSILIKDVANAH